MNSMKKETGAARNSVGLGLDIAFLSGLCLVCAGTAFANLHLKATGGTGILVCAGGSLAYAAYQKIKKIDRSRSLDYQQSGEAALGAILLITMAGFAGLHPIATSAVLLLSLAAFEIYAHSYLRLERRELAFGGLVLMIIAAVFVLFLSLFNSSFDPSAVRGVFLPFAGDLPMDALRIALPALAIALYVPASIASPEISLLSQGRSFTESGGVPYRGAFALALCAKGVCASLVLLSLGWMGGAAGYLPATGTRSLLISDAMHLLTAFLYAQILLFIAVFWGVFGALAVSILVSWGAYILKFGIGDSVHGGAC